MKEKNNNNDQHPFQVDKNYFDKLESSIMSKVKGEGYHLPLGLSHPYKAPKGYLEVFEVRKNTLLSLNISHPFRAPEGYFEALDAKVLGQISDKNKLTPSLKVSWNSYRTYFRIAAAVVLVGLFSLSYFGNPFAGQEEQLSLAALNSDEILTYLEDENLAFEDFEEVISLETDFNLEENDNIEIQDYTDDELLELIDFQFANEI